MGFSEERSFKFVKTLPGMICLICSCEKEPGQHLASQLPMLEVFSSFINVSLWIFNFLGAHIGLSFWGDEILQYSLQGNDLSFQALFKSISIYLCVYYTVMSVEVIIFSLQCQYNDKVSFVISITLYKSLQNLTIYYPFD